MPIASTSPSAPSVGEVRAPTADVLGTIILPLKNLIVGPPSRVTLTDGSQKHFTQVPVACVGRGRSQGLPTRPFTRGQGFPQGLLEAPGHRQDRAGLTNPSVGCMYIAPHRIGSASVLAGSMVSVRAGRGHIVIEFQVEIVRRDWVIETDFTLGKISCDQESIPSRSPGTTRRRASSRINDGGAITLTASLYKYEAPVWQLCPARRDREGVHRRGLLQVVHDVIADKDGFADLVHDVVGVLGVRPSKAYVQVRAAARITQTRCRDLRRHLPLRG